ncbi:MAG: hypothetical protein ACR2KV_10465 [Solirubrobacteraceae bacterium]
MLAAVVTNRSREGGRMTDIKAIQGQVQERLSELEELIEHLSSEFEQLKTIAGMLAQTNGGSSTAAPKARRRPGAKATRAPAAATTGARAQRGGNRAQRGGNRAQQALDLIAAQPGLTAAELADAMKMKRNYLYRVLPALEKDGRISKRGQGYHPAGTPATS